MPICLTVLGEAYYTNKQFDLALNCYEKALKLGRTKGNAEKMIEKIEKIKENN